MKHTIEVAHREHMTLNRHPIPDQTPNYLQQKNEAPSDSLHLSTHTQI